MHRTIHSAPRRRQQGLVLEVVLLVSVWTGLLAGGIWVLQQRMIPSLEQALAADVSAAVAPIASNRIRVRQDGRVATLAGKVVTATERRRVLAAARNVPWVADVVDRLEPTADLRLLETDLGLLPKPPRPRALAPEQPREGEPRTRVFGAILPPWRAPAVYRKPTPRITTDVAPARTGLDDMARVDARPRIPAVPRTRPDAVILASSRADGAAIARTTAADGSSVVSDVRPAGSIDSVRALKRQFNALADTQISFESGSDVLQSPSLVALDRIASVIRAHPDVLVSIGGHTDASGNELKNLFLSQARANAVRDYLVARAVSPYRLLAQGFGETLPIADNETAEGKAANRRIEFTFGETDAL